MVMQWTVNPPPMARLVRSQYSPPSFMQRWQSGPMHETANLENRQFKSDPLLQVWIVSSIGRALHCHCRGKGIETPTVRQVLSCSSRGLGHDPFTVGTRVRISYETPVTIPREPPGVAADC